MNTLEEFNQFAEDISKGQIQQGVYFCYRKWWVTDSWEEEDICENIIKKKFKARACYKNLGERIFKMHQKLGAGFHFIGYEIGDGFYILWEEVMTYKKEDYQSMELI